MTASTITLVDTIMLVDPKDCTAASPWTGMETLAWIHWAPCVVQAFWS